MELEFVDNEPKYYEFIRLLRLHPDNILGFVNQNHISESEQLKYMEKFHQYFNICLCDGEPVGFIGVIENDIRVATKPEFKNKGIGKFMVNEMLKKYPDALAKIKVGNTSSIKLFESCGFKTEYITMKKCQ